MYDKQAIGARIKRIRINSGKTQENFGNLFSASKGNVAMWEKGATLPNKKRLLEISKMANISLDELLHGELLPYIRENLSFRDVESYFEEIDQFVGDRLTDMIFNLVNVSRYSDVFERGIYQEILNLCQSKLKDGVDYLIFEGGKIYKSFNTKERDILELNREHLLVDKFLNGVEPQNIDYITEYRFIIEFSVNGYKFDTEIVDYKKPLVDLYEILDNYFYKQREYEDLIVKTFSLASTLKKLDYKEDEIGHCLISFLEKDLGPALLDKYEQESDKHDR